MTDWRFDPIADRWAIVAPGRDDRPVDREVVRRATPGASDAGPAGADECPFCPGGEDELEVVLEEVVADGVWVARAVANRWPFVAGADRQEVLIESRRHAEDFEALSPDERRTAVELWWRRMSAGRSEDPNARLVLFRNQGFGAGSSRSHPHAQLVTLASPPESSHGRTDRMRRLHRESGVCLLCDPSDAAVRAEAGPVFWEGPYFIGRAVPAPLDPFHLRLAPRRHAASFVTASPEEREALAALLGRVVKAIRDETGGLAWNLLLHDLGPRNDAGLHWHIEIRPRASRIAGFEQTTGYGVCSVSPEEAAERLQNRLDHRDTRDGIR